MKSLEEKISSFERVARELEPSQSKRIELQKRVLNITNKFLDNLDDMPAYIGPENYSIESIIGEFETTESEDKVFEEIQVAVDVPGINPASGNHLGYIPGGGVFTSALGDYWADITNRYAGIYFADPGAVKIENELIRWMINLVDYPEDSWGNLASGGSIANLTAIICAREAKSITPDKIDKAVIYLTGQTHHCITKALKIAGLHHSVVRNVPMDQHLRMNTTALNEMVFEDKENGMIPFLVVSSAGTTDSGIIDPIEEIDILAKKYGIWHHVDAAYGGFFLLTDSCSSKLKAMKLADSLVMDPHKSLFLPYGSGVVLVKNRKHLLEAFSYQASYMQDAQEDDLEISPADVSPELTKHFRGLRMWLPMKLHGINPFRACLEEKHYLAKYFHREITKIEGFEVYQEPELSVVMFRYNKPDVDLNEFNKNLVKAIHDDGRIFLSSTTINGNYWLRVAILVFRTHLQAIDLTLEILKEKTMKMKA